MRPVSARDAATPEDLDRLRERFLALGYSEVDALGLALAEAEPDEVAAEINRLVCRGCPRALARKIAR